MSDGNCGCWLFNSFFVIIKSETFNQEFKSSFGNGKHHGIIQNLIKHHLKGLEDRDIWNKVEPHFERPNLIEISIKTFDDEANKDFE